ncbi:MAG: response regulator [Opitutaceae bacterium]|nr:response regulator [Cytophagales bacterium]
MIRNFNIDILPSLPIRIILADDDSDDCFFFGKALLSSSVASQLVAVHNGDRFMEHIGKTQLLPHIAFLDLNMPGKNGSDCLYELKNNPDFKDLPVIIYSTSLHTDIVDHLYNEGAHYYLSKPDLSDLKIILHYILRLRSETPFNKPPREKFVLNAAFIDKPKEVLN